jgi:hypothetical protein
MHAKESAMSVVNERIVSELNAPLHGFRYKFPTQRNRELFLRNRVF